MAQIVRAILLASATATSLRGLRASSFTSHSVACLFPGRTANRITAVAPVTSNRRNRSLPARLIPPMRCLPPVECSFGVRPIQAVWLDATYVRVRQNGRIVSVAVIIAVGVNDDGRREVLGMTVGASEAETFWTDFLRSLARRGLRGVKLVISDAHEGQIGRASCRERVFALV